MKSKTKSTMIILLLLLYTITSFVFAENTFECNPDTDPEGDWEFYEACHDPKGSLDEQWTEDQWDDWSAYNRSGEWAGNWTYSHNNTGGYVFNWTMLNTSGMNRTQTLTNIHHNQTEGTNITMGYIVGNVSAKFYYVGAGEGIIEYLYYDGTWYDVYSGDPIDIADSADDNITNWYNIAPAGYYDSGEDQESPYYWEIAPTYANGSWLKMIYNAHCDHMQFKCWGDPTLVGIYHEPAGWAIDNFADLQGNETVCLGYGIHNPDALVARSDFDIGVFFQENYTLNSSAITPLYPEGQPYMEFKLVNATFYSENLTRFLDDAFSGDMDSEDIADYLMNITNATIKNSRPYAPDDSLDTSPWEQNDTIRYYSATLYNCSEFGWVYDTYLYLDIHVTPYGPTQTLDAFVAINVDGDDTWDDNDRAYFIDSFGIQWEFHGPNFNPTFDINATIYVSESEAFQNIHRYYNHTHALFLIPVSHLVKEDGTVLNASEPFNITIFTGATYDDNICWWHNWNETACSPRTSEVLAESKQYYINETAIAPTGLDINGTNIALWGMGEITGDATKVKTEYHYAMDIEKQANVTSIYQHDYYPINYTIWINNTGTDQLTNVYVNDTKFNCSCHHFNETQFIDSNLPLSNITNFSCYRWFYIGNVQVDENYRLWYIVNVTNCTGTTTGTLWNNVTVNATELATDQTASENVSWGVYATRVCVNYRIALTDMASIGNSVFAIVGVLLIIGSILLIIGIMYTKGFIKFK